MTDAAHHDDHDHPLDTGHDDERVETRSDLLPEEQAAGSEDPHGQAEAILQESDERTEHPSTDSTQSATRA